MVVIEAMSRQLVFSMMKGHRKEGAHPMQGLLSLD
jgi:hypothetical protein